MKRPLLVIAFIISSICALHAQLTRFYYYPKTNIYYNVEQKEYIYNNSGSWTNTATLPATISVAGSPRVVMYSMKPDIWQMNDEHVEYYKSLAEKGKRKLFSFKKDDDDDDKK